MVEPKQKNWVLAVALNAVLPGVGYMYMGRIVLGVLVLLFIPLLIVFSGGVAWFGWMLIMGIDMYLLHRKNQREFDAVTLKKCPSCAEMVQREALVCKHCHTKLAPSAAPALID